MTESVIQDAQHLDPLEKGGFWPIEYREIRKEELGLDLFENFERHQTVIDCLRRVQGQWVVKKAPFVDQWSREDYNFLVKCLKKTLEENGLVLGGFLEGKLKGFVSVEGKLFGIRSQYLDLTSLHVSEDMRGHGMGKTLFSMAASWAKEHGAEKLYISSHSAVETQKFYEALGCVDAQEYCQKHIEQEPYDRQLEFLLLQTE